MPALDGVQILLVDDHAVVRSSLGMLLQIYGAEIVGEAAGGAEAVSRALDKRPDVILMDITLPDLDGIEATRQIVSAWPEARVLALTMHAEDSYLAPFVEAGGLGYVRKSAADREVVAAIDAVRQGKTYLGEGGLESLLRFHRQAARRGRPGPEVLSERERLVLEQTARGFTSREIGEQLNISAHTVDTYRARVMEKLGLEHRHELVEFALQHRLLG